MVMLHPYQICSLARGHLSLVLGRPGWLRGSPCCRGLPACLVPRAGMAAGCLQLDWVSTDRSSPSKRPELCRCSIEGVSRDPLHGMGARGEVSLQGVHPGPIVLAAAPGPPHLLSAGCSFPARLQMPPPQQGPDPASAGPVAEHRLETPGDRLNGPRVCTATRA